MRGFRKIKVRLIKILFHSFCCNFDWIGRKNRSLYWGLLYRGFIKLRFRCIKKRNTVNSVLRGHLKDRHLPKMDTNMYRRVSSCCSLVILFDSLKENTTRKWMHNHVHLQSGTILVETICPKGLLWHFASLKGENKEKIIELVPHILGVHFTSREKYTFLFQKMRHYN